MSFVPEKIQKIPESPWMVPEKYGMYVIDNENVPISHH